MSYERLGDVRLQLGQTKAALDSYEKSLAGFQRLADADPKNAQAQSDLGVCYDKLGDVQLQLGQTKAALDFYEKALAVDQRLAEADPKNAQAQTDLFVSNFKLGFLYQTMHDYEKASVSYAKGREILLPWHEKGLLVGQFKNAVPQMDQRITVCQNAEKAIADIEFVFKQLAKQIPELLVLRVQALLKRGKPAEAVTTAERFARWAETLDEKLRNNERYNAACVYALCAAAIEKDRDKLVDQAIALLQKAQAGGYFKAEQIAHIEQDRDFDGIRTHPKFVAFLKELEKPTDEKK
ncbi:MAG: tetratricopeptide repeat protein [Gemmataceae bacterium]|nr:tetratricopeptide repeat protein [Gemmataceae bacterium]